MTRHHLRCCIIVTLLTVTFDTGAFAQQEVSELVVGVSSAGGELDHR